MRGSPLFRALVAFGFILLLGLPLARMTRAAAVVAAVVPHSESVREIRLALTFTVRPTSVRVRHLGKEIWTVQPAEMESEKTVSLLFPKEGVDLEFEAKFSDGAPLAAMRVRLTDPEGGEHEKTCWGRGEIDEVLSFP